MAGEWIPIDIGIWQKPEIQELVDLTGTAEDSVVGRLVRMWGWASLHTATGIIRATPERLARLHGGDAAFWLAVETVGWVSFDAAAGTMTVAGWEARFSKAAKARAADRIRKSLGRQQDSGDVPGSVQEVSGENRTETGPEERRGQLPPPPPPRARGNETQAAVIRKAWTVAAEAGFVKPHLASDLPPAIWDRLAEPGWIDDALLAIERLPRCRFFEEPATLRQLVKAGFVGKVLDGTFDSRKKPKAAATAPDGRPSAEEAARRYARTDPKVASAVAEYVASKQARRARA